MVLWDDLCFVIVRFPGHTHLLFENYIFIVENCSSVQSRRLNINGIFQINSILVPTLNMFTPFVLPNHVIV